MISQTEFERITRALPILRKSDPPLARDFMAAAFLARIPAGRVVRIVAGLVLIVLGLAVVGGTGGIVMAVIGLLPLLAGLLDFCAFAPLFGAPLSGPKIRAGK